MVWRCDDLSDVIITVTPGERRPAGFGNRLARFAAVVGWMMLATGCGSRQPDATGPDDVSIPPIEVPESRMPDGPIPAEFKVPKGKGPFPAVIVLHGCGGPGASQAVWAARLNAWGYASLAPDSMTPRGVKRVCEPEAQSLVTPWDRVGDVGSAAAWLRTRPEIDPNRIAVLGLSHGGATAVLATQRYYADFKLRAAIDYDGPCVEPATHGTVPVLVLAGEADDWGHPAARCTAYARAVDGGQVVDVITYPGVYHAFANPAMVRTVSNNHIMEYNQAAADDSFVHAHEFLDRWVKK
jgi:dienelactone hydrolase